MTVLSRPVPSHGDHDDHGDHYDHDDHDDHGDHEEVGGYTKKLEVVQKEVGGCLSKCARNAASITLNDESLLTHSVYDETLTHFSVPKGKSGKKGALLLAGTRTTPPVHLLDGGRKLIEFTLRSCRAALPVDVCS